MNEDLLKLGVLAVKAGDLEKARTYFVSVVQTDPNSEQGWFFLGDCLTDQEKKKYCFQKVLALNPSNQQAVQALASLIPSDDPVQFPQPVIQENTPEQVPESNTGQPQKGSSRFLPAMIAGLAGIAVCLAALIVVMIFRGVIEKSSLPVQTTILPVKSATLTATLPVTATATITVPLALATPTVIPTLPTPVSAWSLVDPRDPGALDLIHSSKDGYQLDPNWVPVHIEYVYQWWGLGDPVFNDQQLEYQGGRYLKNQVEVPSEKVKSFINAIAHLHPTQFLLAGNDHTDDYPSWKVEMTDQAGNQVMLFSSSTGNPGEAPWNVLYNGRLYAQYDGSIGDPLMALFPGPAGQPAAAFFPGGSSANSVAFATGGWPAQLTEGFVGLLPIADGFSYQADAKTGKIKGFILGRSSIGGMGTMLIGKITKVDKVNLTASDGSQRSCDIKPVASSDPASAAWSFECTVNGVVAGTHYRYPLEVAFNTDNNQQSSTQGQLVGVWGSSGDVLYLPLSDELQTIFAQNKVSRDLLTDHIPVRVSYTAQMDPKLPQFGTLAGEVILLGQTQIQGQTLRYSIATPFAIEGGTLAYWSLTRAALNKMLGEIGQLPLTKRVMETSNAPELNMWYAENGTMPALPQLINGSIPHYSLAGASCGDVSAWSLPSDNQPLEAFGFNNGWSFWESDFVLLNGKPIVNALDLMPKRNDRGGLLSLLIPRQLDTGDHPLFDRIWLEAKPYGGKQPVLTLWVPQKADAASLAAYEKIAKSLPVAVEKIDATDWEASGLTFVVQDDGSLGIKACTGH